MIIILKLKVTVIEIKPYQLNLNKIRACLKGIMKSLKNYHTWKIQLTIAINFISSKDNDKECVIHKKTGSIEIMINVEADEVNKEPFEYFLTDIKLDWKNQ